MKTDLREKKEENPEEIVWDLVEEEISKRAKRISETRKLEQDDIVLFAIRSLKRDVDHLNNRVNELDNRLSSRIDSNFKWILGIIIVMWVSIILTIIFV